MTLKVTEDGENGQTTNPNKHTSRGDSCICASSKHHRNTEADSRLNKETSTEKPSDIRRKQKL